MDKETIETKNPKIEDAHSERLQNNTESRVTIIIRLPKWFDEKRRKSSNCHKKK